jgi:hypothetical protein
METDTLIDITPGLIREPTKQSTGSASGVTANDDARDAGCFRGHRDTARAAAAKLEQVPGTAQRNRRAVRERHSGRLHAQALANPLDVFRNERAGFSEIALHGQSDNHRTARAEHAKRHPPRSRVPPHLDLGAKLAHTRRMRCDKIVRRQQRSASRPPQCLNILPGLNHSSPPCCLDPTSIRARHHGISCA